MQTAAVKTRRWKYSEYFRLAELGFFDRQRVELVGGRIVKMAPQKDVHSSCVGLARDAAAVAFGPGYWPRVQCPLHLGTWSGPEPDIAVVPGGPRDYIGTGHPTGALLIIEVSDTTLRYDRRVKGGLYAKYGIRDYWIVNLIDRQVEVNRDPIPDPAHIFRHRYATRTEFKSGDSIQLLAVNAAIPVRDLLP